MGGPSAPGPSPPTSIRSSSTRGWFRRRLAGQDAPYEVHADLIVDPRTVSRYKWSSSGGPPVKIVSGTLASANVAVSTRRPIELVVPFVKQVTGL